MPSERPIRESGQIVRLEGEIAVIQMAKASACEGCAASGVCHSLSGSDLRELRAVNRIEASPGEQVEVEIPRSAALHAATWVYVVPTLLMLAVALVVHYTLVDGMSGDRAGLITAGSALGALALFILGAWLWRQHRGPDYSRYPTVVRTL